MAATEPISTGSRIEAEVRGIRALVEKREFARALADASRLLGKVPENRDVLYLVAVSQRYLGRITEALATLERFEKIHPDFGRLFQERGHCYRTAEEGVALWRLLSLAPMLVVIVGSFASLPILLLIVALGKVI